MTRHSKLCEFCILTYLVSGDPGEICDSGGTGESGDSGDSNDSDESGESGKSGETGESGEEVGCYA